MATLNIKNFPDRLYGRLRRRAEKSRRSIAQEVTQILDEATQPARRASLLELKGLGKDVWRRELDGKDAAEWLSGERDAWR